jgi:hypothetical protein
MMSMVVNRSWLPPEEEELEVVDPKLGVVRGAAIPPIEAGDEDDR